MRILVLNSEIPIPPITGAQTRTYQLVKALSAKNDVTLVGFSWGTQDSPTSGSLSVTVVRVPWELPESYCRMRGSDPFVSEAAYRQLAFQNAEPWFVSYYDSAAMERALAELSSKSFDLILIEHSFMARFLPSLPVDVPKVLDMHNVHTLMASRRVKRKAGSEKEDAVREFERTKSFERMICSACQLCLCCSDLDAEAARLLLNVEHLRVIPNGVDTSSMTVGAGPVTPGYLLFTGMMNYQPNREAVLYFVKEILPLIRAEAPHVKFHIVGSNPSPEVTALTADDVCIRGAVADMRPYFDQASIVVVPLLSGGGTRLKILDAAACGKPIVSTTLGAEGLNLVDGRDILLADSGTAFARTVLDLLSNSERQAELSRNARRAAEAYDWSEIASKFCQVVHDIGQERRVSGANLQNAVIVANSNRDHAL